MKRNENDYQSMSVEYLCSSKVIDYFKRPTASLQKDWIERTGRLHSIHLRDYYFEKPLIRVNH